MQHFGSHRCGGSIITQTKILTAAHCVRGTVKRFTSIRAGSTYHAVGGVTINVVRTFEHEQFHIPYRYNYDIALLFLAEPLVYGIGIQPIALPNQGVIIGSGMNSLISGWGLANIQGILIYPSNLQSVIVPIVDQDVCKESYGSLQVPAAITDVMICAGLLEGGKDACLGDSGGPLVIDNVLHGVVSWGAGCAQPGLPGVYARTGLFRDWIDNINI